MRAGVHLVVRIDITGEESKQDVEEEETVKDSIEHLRWAAGEVW